MTPPLLLLDVDGVLNALRTDPPAGWRHGEFAGYPLTWDPSVTARLRGWHDDGRIELQWLTTWAANADELLAEPMGLPRGLRVHQRDDAGPTGFLGSWSGGSGWWKLLAARSVVADDPGRRVVWVDDDLADQAEDTDAWLTANPQVLVVAPELTTGLTHAQLDEVDRWLDRPGPDGAG